MKKVKLIVTSGDQHANSLVGLCPPEYEREGGGVTKPSPAQVRSWNNWLDFWGNVGNTKASLDAEVIAVFLGDLVDKNYRNPAGLISVHDPDIIELGLKVIQPALEVCDRHFIIRGTAAHTGGLGALEELIARESGAVPDPETGAHSWWWLPLLVYGTRFSFRHHPHTKGFRPWTQQPALARESAIVMFECAKRGYTIPDVSVFAHVHHYGDSGDATHPRVFFTPPWQWTSDFGFRLGVAEDVEPLGGILFTVTEDGWTFRARRYFPKERDPWKIQ